MGELAWVRKYRPSSFDDYIGNNVKNTIVNRLRDRSNLPHTIMLYGTRGTGKTSMARLICKEIYCMNPIDGHSCGTCEMCIEINNYITSTEAGVECFGIVEVNAASTTGKSDIDDIIADALLPPEYPLQYKVIILDECHMLSQSAQNSLLKVIEEPPEHLVFILCTTDPDKVLPTIHSRMQVKIEVRKKTVDEIANKLLEISKSENLTVSKDALRVIAKRGERIPRECINLLESIAKNNGNVVTLETLNRSLGDISTDIYIKFFESANSGLEDILTFNFELKEKDIGYKNFINGLTRFILDACYIKYGVALDDYSKDFVDKVGKLFKIYSSSEFDVLLQLIQDANRSLDDNDTKSELTITTLAIQVGKVGIFSNGLKDTENDTLKENKKSIRQYRKMVESKEADSINNVRNIIMSDTASLTSIFKDATEVENDIDIVTGDTEDKNEENSQFMSKEELYKMLDD